MIPIVKRCADKYFETHKSSLMVHRMYQNLKTLIENTPNTAYFVARNASSCGSFAATLRIAYLIEKYAFSQKMCNVFAAYQLLNSLIYASEDNCHGIITVLTKDYHLSVIDDSLRLKPVLNINIINKNQHCN